jgi:hypothetical protein
MVQIYNEEEAHGAHTVEAILYFFDHRSEGGGKKKEERDSSLANARNSIAGAFNNFNQLLMPSSADKSPPPADKMAQMESFVSDDDFEGTEESKPKNILSETNELNDGETSYPSDSMPAAQPLSQRLNLSGSSSTFDVEVEPSVSMRAPGSVDDEPQMLMVTSAPGGLHVSKITGTRIPAPVMDKYSEVVEERGKPAKTDKSRRALSNLLSMLKSLRYTLDSHTTVVTPTSPLPVHCFLFSLQPAAPPSNAAPPATHSPTDHHDHGHHQRSGQHHHHQPPLDGSTSFEETYLGMQPQRPPAEPDPMPGTNGGDVASLMPSQEEVDSDRIPSGGRRHSESSHLQTPAPSEPDTMPGAMLSIESFESV